MKEVKRVLICYPVRTPTGSFMGKLSSFTAVDLCTSAIKALIEVSELDIALIDEVIIGNVLSANLGQNPAKQVALNAGIPVTVPCTTINKVCSSGIKSVFFGVQSILANQNKLVIAGGMESMSNVPYYAESQRKGNKFGDCKLVDGLLKDGLTCPFNKISMGLCAENCANKIGISREQQDKYSIESYTFAQEAFQKGYFQNEIIPLTVKQGKDEEKMTMDEELKNVNFDKIPTLRSAFKADGTITAANSSKISDGASVMILVDEDFAKEFHLKPVARIIGFADASSEPIDFPLAPYEAIQKVLKDSHLDKNQIDFWEINEAFAIVPLAIIKMLEIDRMKVNVNGGAVSLGHPLGCSGARILTTLAHTLKTRNGRFGIAAICNGGGGASAIIIENVEYDLIPYSLRSFATKSS